MAYWSPMTDPTLTASCPNACCSQHGRTVQLGETPTCPNCGTTLERDDRPEKADDDRPSRYRHRMMVPRPTP